MILARLKALRNTGNNTHCDVRKEENNVFSTREELKSFGESLIRSGIKYYIDSVLKDGGSLSDIRKGYSGMKIFDPMFVKETNLLTLREYIDKLRFLSISKIDQVCLEEMKNEFQDLTLSLFFGVELSLEKT